MVVEEMTSFGNALSSCKNGVGVTTNYSKRDTLEEPFCLSWVISVSGSQTANIPKEGKSPWAKYPWRFDGNRAEKKSGPVLQHA